MQLVLSQNSRIKEEKRVAQTSNIMGILGDEKRKRKRMAK